MNGRRENRACLNILSFHSWNVQNRQVPIGIWLKGAKDKGGGSQGCIQSKHQGRIKGTYIGGYKENIDRTEDPANFGCKGGLLRYESFRGAS
jgi:hypothetical protein